MLLTLSMLLGLQAPSVWNGSRPVVVGVGDGKELAQFPSSLSRFGSSDNLLLIAAGNPDGFISRRRDCPSAAPPSTFSRCFNSDGERASAK